MHETLVTLDDIRQAADRIRPYARVTPLPGEKPLRSQELLARQAQSAAQNAADTSRREMRVLRKAQAP